MRLPDLRLGSDGALDLLDGDKKGEEVGELSLELPRETDGGEFDQYSTLPIPLQLSLSWSFSACIDLAFDLCCGCGVEVKRLWWGGAGDCLDMLLPLAPSSFKAPVDLFNIREFNMPPPNVLVLAVGLRCPFAYG